jgi:leucyl aminopeptidase
MTKLKARRGTVKDATADAVVALLFEDEKILERQYKSLANDIQGLPALKRVPFKGKENETVSLHPAETRFSSLLLVGLGHAGKLSQERLRRASAVGAKAARDLGAETLAVLEPDPDVVGRLKTDPGSNAWESIGIAIGEGILLGLYRFDKYRSEKDDLKATPTEALVVSSEAKRLAAIQDGLEYASVVCEGTILARDLENAPGNEIYPETLAKRAARAGRKAGFSVKALRRKEIKKLGMGGLLAVSQGSNKPPRFIVMECNSATPKLPTVVLVGKGVTFDSGGISIKPAQNMAEMKMDMSGAAAVIGTMQAAAAMKLPFHLIGLVPATENLLSGDALKPGDIITHHNGKTSEVDNTDAEGRLILADALSYASKFKPDLVIDLATLTGAVVVALGHHATGMMGNAQSFMDRLKESGERAYERVWQLPMFEEYDRQIKSDVADVKNVGGRWGGAITAAAFLKKFIGPYQWVHLDIAGTAILEESTEYLSKGGSGVGVRLLVDFLRHWRKQGNE